MNTSISIASSGAVVLSAARHARGRLALKARGRGQGFTLVELLVVIAIIAVLAGLIFPAFSKSLDNAKRTNCSSNQRQLGVAVLAFAADNDGSLPRTTQNGGQPWANAVFPYIPTAGNSATSSVVSKTFICPAETLRVPDGYTGSAFQYVASRVMEATDDLNGETGVGDPPAGPRKIMSIERPTESILFADGKMVAGDYTCAPGAVWSSVAADVAVTTIKGSFSVLSFRHSESLNVLFADGHSGNVSFKDRAELITQPGWTGQGY